MIQKKVIAVEPCLSITAVANVLLGYLPLCDQVSLGKASKGLLAILKLDQPNTPAYKMHEFLQQLGMIYPVKFSDGRHTLACVVTLEGIKKVFGCNTDEEITTTLNTIFQGCGGKETFNQATDVCNGILVNLDFYQQVALLRAIAQKHPELADMFGLYNLRGARKVYEVLNTASLHRTHRIFWFWTGEKYVPSQTDDKYPAEGLLPASSIDKIKGNRFCVRDINYVHWDNDDPDYHGDDGAFVLGGYV